jgi:isopentenyl-diphosphate delta-isomerase
MNSLTKNINPYYKQKQMIAKVDRQGNIIGEIEKWEAHKKGILHRAISVALLYKGEYVIQHRKHIAFDGTFDITVSSHQLMVQGKIEDTVECTLRALKREFFITLKDLKKKPSIEGFVYYKAKDSKSEFTEHEIDDILVAELKNLPTPNYEFAYGYSLVTKDELKRKNSRLHQNLAPWVKVMIKERKI